MGRRKGSEVKRARIDVAALTPVLEVALGVLGFVLEVAMVAAFLFWGFKQDSPWNLILGLGIPAVIVVGWGVFLVPRSKKYVGERIGSWVSLGLFFTAAVALFSAGSTVLGILMLALTAAHFAAGTFLAKQR
ncbi:YrdB family protein [Arthrobacter sp. TMP15]|uniref:YrdB family protein n=1 Tax=Arthrobacter sp. TMP15 TaxID=3140789 RepID=UPI0031B9ACAF